MCACGHVCVCARARARACMRVGHLGDEGKGETVEHDVDRIGEAARDAAGHAGHGGAEQQLHCWDEQHPCVLRQLLPFERQEPSVEVTELQEVAHVLEVDEVDVCRHPHAARELEEVHVPALYVKDVLVEHGLRLESAVAHVPRAALPAVGCVGLDGDALPQAVCAHGGGESSPAISPASALVELRISLAALALLRDETQQVPRLQGETQQVPRQGGPGMRLERRHRLGGGVIAVDKEALRTRGG